MLANGWKSGRAGRSAARRPARGQGARASGWAATPVIRRLGRLALAAPAGYPAAARAAVIRRAKTPGRR